jgi:hypothetical protein
LNGFMNTEWHLQTSVAFFIFNRPDTAARVFEEIRRARPHKLLVVADGPRPDQPGEAEKCAATRNIIEQVDWPCEVLKNYSDTNLGCGRRVSSGLDWVFQTVEEAIILEDDCLPCEDFFFFCEKLLNRYRYDDDVMSICGTNFLKGIRRGEYSYYFSSHFHVWGWASWRRAWVKYDYKARNMTEDKLRIILDSRFISSGEKRFFKNIFKDMKAFRIDTWDYQWLFTHLFNDGLTIIPNVNLITNIGPTGTHFSNDHGNPRMNLPTGTIVPLVFNENKKPDKHADLLLYRLNFRCHIKDFSAKVLFAKSFQIFFRAVKNAIESCIRR